MPRLDLETIDGKPHSCAGCGRVLLRDDGGLICACPRFAIYFKGGPDHGYRERLLLSVVHGKAPDQLGIFDDGHYERQAFIDGAHHYGWVTKEEAAA